MYPQQILLHAIYHNASIQNSTTIQARMRLQITTPKTGEFLLILDWIALDGW